MNKAPAFQFYTGDWLKDPALSMCSPATRGIWMDILCAAHELARSGQITGTPDQLARICRCTAADFIAAVNELQTTGTADVRERRGIYTITNRRMRRAWLEKEDNRARQQKRRGNPSNLPEIRQEKRDLESVQIGTVAILSQSVNDATIADLEQVTESSHDCHTIVTPYSSSSSSSSINTHEIHGVINTNPEQDFFDAEQVVESPENPKPKPAAKTAKAESYGPQVKAIFAYWQARLNHPKSILTPARHRCIEARLKEGYALDEIKRAIDGCLASPFHQGDNDQKAVYDDIELICRNGQKVEMFIAKVSPANGHANGLARQLDEAGNQAYKILFGEESNPQPYIDAEVLS